MSKNERLINASAFLMKLQGSDQKIDNAIQEKALALNRRDPVKYSGAAKMYLLSIVETMSRRFNLEAGCEFGRLALASYHFIREIDDILDGDNELEAGQNPLIFIQNVRNQIESGVFLKDSLLSQLAEFSFKALEDRSEGNDDPRADMLMSIDWMVFDNVRAKERRVLSAPEVQEYYEHSFVPIVNIMLIGLQSVLRVHDVPGLALSQPRVFSVRDLETDWERGIINVPKEVLEKANLNGNSPVEDVRSSTAFKEWSLEQTMRACDEAAEVRKTLDELEGEKTTKLMCNQLLKTVDALVDQYLP